MRKSILFILSGILHIGLYGQVSFTDASERFVNATVASGVAMGVADLNNDGLDDIIRLNTARDLLIEYQQPDGSFVIEDYGDIGPGSEYAICIADADNDGYNDILTGGAYNKIKLLRTGADGVDSLYWIPLPDVFAQGMNFTDINNDGRVDIFACHDDGVSGVWENLGNHSWSYNLGLINPASTVPSDNSGNYGSVWTDFDSDGDLDVYISKCRLGVSDPYDGRRINLLFENDGSNQFTEVGESMGLVAYAQSWSADFGDIDNDGDLDCFVINHDSTSKIYENIGNTHFIDITAASGIASELAGFSTGIQGIFDDFDNDGFIDLMVTGAVNHFLFRNNGDGTFAAEDAFPAGTMRIHSMAIGDLNNDGFLDMIAGHANGYNTPEPTRKDQLFLNNGNENHWIKARVSGPGGNASGIGARATLYGPWGVQIREVRSGEGYGIQNSLEVHFGLGAETQADSLVVSWPSGVVDRYRDVPAGQTLEVVEGCRPDYQAATELDTVLCNGDSLWVDGAWISEAGVFGYSVPSSGGCDSTIRLTVGLNSPDVSVTSSDNLLTAAAGYIYQWIDCASGLPVNGQTGVSLTGVPDGNYAVEVTDGACTAVSECTALLATPVVDLTRFPGKIYPNPFRNQLLIEPAAGDFPLRLRMIDASGRVLQESVSQKPEPVIWDTSMLTPGIYLIEATQGVERHVVRVVKL